MSHYQNYWSGKNPLNSRGSGGGVGGGEGSAARRTVHVSLSSSSSFFLSFFFFFSISSDFFQHIFGLQMSVCPKGCDVPGTCTTVEYSIPFKSIITDCFLTTDTTPELVLKVTLQATSKL